jgi:pimeloyl-ACP methyl ester carboxylesterase
VRNILVALCVIVLLGAAIIFAVTWQIPAMGAGALLHPARHLVYMARPAGCEDAAFSGERVQLHGWTCAATAPRRGTIVYLHGIADNRTSAAGVIARFQPRGFDVIAYDSRAHGQSDGDVCTYGFYEKQDLHRVLDALAAGPIVLIGNSLGGAVALQEAAEDPRVTAVVAAETFSSLRAVATERAPSFFTKGEIRKAFELASKEGRFDIDAVSPENAAMSIRVPVLLIHGAADKDTPPVHSQRVLAALRGPKRLILVPGAGHNQSLQSDVWTAIEDWVDRVSP